MCGGGRVQAAGKGLHGFVLVNCLGNRPALVYNSGELLFSWFESEVF